MVTICVAHLVMRECRAALRCFGKTPADANRAFFIRGPRIISLGCSTDFGNKLVVFAKHTLAMSNYTPSRGDYAIIAFLTLRNSYISIAMLLIQALLTVTTPQECL